ncbi:hypothetical protein BDV96DRAFT_672909 [Lophiotrema nucula]|uniref:Uncharacterized protein n=1 Tax=Lophiotrema nucula TaxID=690887 RepID=A0A6A5YM26_9PLEO|nr:hypothetical protein BDV96DRAFT_672909 [Lophiotrema nucula]
MPRILPKLILNIDVVGPGEPWRPSRTVGLCIALTVSPHNGSGRCVVACTFSTFEIYSSSYRGEIELVVTKPSPGRKNYYRGNQSLADHVLCYCRRQGTRPLGARSDGEDRASSSLRLQFTIVGRIVIPTLCVDPMVLGSHHCGSGMPADDCA